MAPATIRLAPTSRSSATRIRSSACAHGRSVHPHAAAISRGPTWPSICRLTAARTAARRQTTTSRRWPRNAATVSTPRSPPATWQLSSGPVRMPVSVYAMPCDSLASSLARAPPDPCPTLPDPARPPSLPIDPTTTGYRATTYRTTIPSSTSSSTIGSRRRSSGRQIGKSRPLTTCAGSGRGAAATSTRMPCPRGMTRFGGRARGHRRSAPTRASIWAASTPSSPSPTFAPVLVAASPATTIAPIRAHVATTRRRSHTPRWSRARWGQASDVAVFAAGSSRVFANQRETSEAD